jgi:hypothetical protein
MCLRDFKIQAERGNKMPIESFNIPNVRVLGKASCDKVPKLMIIAGPNGVGKSTLLNELRRFSDRVKGSNLCCWDCLVGWMRIAGDDYGCTIHDTNDYNARRWCCQRYNKPWASPSCVSATVRCCADTSFFFIKDARSKDARLWWLSNLRHH